MPRPQLNVLALAGLGLVLAGLLVWAGSRPAALVRERSNPLAPAQLEPDTDSPAQRAAPAALPAGPPEILAGEPVAPTSFDRDLRTLAAVRPVRRPDLPERESSRRERSAGAAVLGGPFQDRALQAASGARLMPAAQASFKGLDLTNFGGGWPPDTTGDVGPNHYIQAVNTSVAIFNKSGTRLAAVSFNQFFSAASGGTPCQGNHQGDPVVLYDGQSGRWLITDFAFTLSGSTPTPPYYECLAVSKTADPVSGGWWLYALKMSETDFFDYPKLGVWSDGIYLTANMFPSAAYAYPAWWALNRDDLISGQPVRSVRVNLSTSYWSLLPANLRGAAPPAGTPALFLSLAGYAMARDGDYYNDYLQLWQFRPNWATPASSVITGPISLAVSEYTMPWDRTIPTPGASLDTLSDRMMMQLQYRNLGGAESLWAVHTVTATGNIGLRWYEVRNPASASPTVYQQGTFQPADGLARWLPSLAVDGAGNMALGYSAAGAAAHPSINYVGRLVTDTLGTLGGAEATLIAGAGSQNNIDRWGDYSTMTVDPADDCTFWFTTEYYEATGYDWQTRIGSFQYPACLVPVDRPFRVYVPQVSR